MNFIKLNYISKTNMKNLLIFLLGFTLLGNTVNSQSQNNDEVQSCVARCANVLAGPSCNDACLGGRNSRD